MTESRSLHSIKHEPRQHLGCLCASSPHPQFHKPSRAGFTSVSIQHLAQQSTKTEASIPSKSLFKVTHPRGCWLAEAGRGEGSSTAEQLRLSQGHQHSFHLPQAPACPGEGSCGHFYLGLDPAPPEDNRSCCTCCRWGQFRSL